MASHECIQSETVKEMSDRISKIDRTLFFGNGHPSVLTQLATISLTLRALTWMTSILAGAVVIQIVSLWFKKG